MPGLVKKDHMYSRLSNPNRDGFEACLASLEGGKRTLRARWRALRCVVSHLFAAALCGGPILVHPPVSAPRLIFP